MTTSVLVMGAGSIGCFVGARLAAAGAVVSFVGRPRVLQALRENGLVASDLEGPSVRLEPVSLTLAEQAGAVPAPGLVLLCVKTPATAQAAGELAAALPAGTPVLSLQNGVGNVEVARTAAPALVFIPGMVPFNVAELGPGRYHRGTTGEVAAEDHPALQPWRSAFDRAGLPLSLHADLRPIQWAKLLLNLNNPVNALSGLPLRAQLLDRGYRRITAALQQEALSAMASSGIRPARLTPLPPERVPAVLRLPTPLFRLVAARMLRIDDKARSSMADDFAAGRATEIDALCGEVIRMAERVGVAVPVNRAIVALVHRWPQQRRAYAGTELLAAVGLA